MPAPSRTSLTEIVRAGARILETAGPEGLTMQGVAHDVGVRAPSLYKHVGGRDELVRHLTEDAVGDLRERLDAAAPEGCDPADGLRAAAQALRAFAGERPAAFRRLFSPGPEATRSPPEVMAQGSTTMLRLARDLVGAEDALPAARTLTAWASGFIAMDLAGAFRLGGDVDAAFEYGLGMLVDALAGRRVG